MLPLAQGVTGVLKAAALGIHAIGLGLGLAMGKDPKHTTKQLDRLPSSEGLNPRTITLL